MLRSLFSNAISVLAEKGVTIVLTFVLTPILLKELGIATYGVWILLINMVAWARISNLGFGTAVTRTAAIYMEKKEYSEMNTLFNSSLLLNLLLGLLGSCIVLLPIFIPSILNLPESYIPEAEFVLFLLCFNVFTFFLLMPVNNFFVAALKQNVMANVSCIQELIKGALSIYLVLKGYGIKGMLLALLVSDFLAFFVKIYFLNKNFPNLRLSFTCIRFKHIRDIFSFSKYLLIANAALIIRSRIGVNVVSKFVGIASVATFNIAQQLVQHCESIINIIGQVVSPAATRVLNRADKSQEANHVSMIARLNLFSTVLVVMPLVIFSESFVGIWLGQEFIFVAVLIKIFSITLISKFVFYTAQTVMIAKAKHKLLPVIHIFGALITIISTVSLANFYGVIGVVYGLVISTALIEFLFFTPVLFRELAQERKNFIAKTALTFCVASSMFLIFEMITSYLVLDSWLYFSGSLLIFLIINTIVFWLLLFDKIEKKNHLKLLGLVK